MANGGELKDYRQKVLNKLLNDKRIVELVLNRSVTEIDSDIQDELTLNHIFKFMCIPKMQDTERAYITFELDGKKSFNGKYKSINIYFFVFCHNNIINDPETGFLRTDLLDERIQELFNFTDEFGIGELVCTDDDYLVVNDYHYGRQLTFQTKDLNAGRCG